MVEVLKAGDKVVMNRDCDFFKTDFREDDRGWWEEMEELEPLVLSYVNVEHKWLDFEGTVYTAQPSWVKKVDQ